MKRKLLALVTLMLCAVTGAWADDTVTASWLAPSSTMTLTGTSTDENGLIANDASLSSALKYVNVWGKNNTYYYVVDRNDNTQDTKGTINTNRYIDFTATVPTGVVFTLNTIEIVGVGAGTGNNSFRVDFIDGDGNTTVRDAATVGSGSESAVSYSFPEPKNYEAGTTITIRAYVGINNTDATKNVGFRDVKMTGTYASSDAPDSAPVITAQPQSENTYIGTAITLSVTAMGKPAPEYQWYSCDDADKTNSLKIKGATSKTYSFTPAEEKTYYFYVTVTNTKGSVISKVVSVTAVPEPTAAPTFKVLGNTVQLETTTSGAVIYYEIDNAEVKSSESKIEYTGAFIPPYSCTIYAYADKNGSTSEVVSKEFTHSFVGYVIGDKIAVLQPESHGDSDSDYENNTYTNNGFSLIGTAKLTNSARGVYDYHFKTSGTLTVKAPAGATIKSIKIYGTSNDASKVATITAGEGATVVTNPAELMPRDVKVDDEQTMTEIVLTVDEPTDGNSVSFTLGRESRLYIEVYGTNKKELTTTHNMAGWKSFYDAYNDYTLDENTTAYVATEVAQDETEQYVVELTPIDCVPSDMAVLLKTTNQRTDGTYSLTLTKAESVTRPNITNLLKPSSGATHSNVYRLGYNAESGVAFFPWTRDTAQPDVVVLELNASNQARQLTIRISDGSETTAIKSVDVNVSANKTVYDLQGRRVTQPSKGLYIVNGKKVIIK